MDCGEHALFVHGCDVMCIGKDFEMQTYITIGWASVKTFGVRSLV